LRMLFVKLIYMQRLLMIDDDQDLLLVTQSVLKKKGYDISAFSNWEKASDAIKKTNPQLIMLDVFLKENDGLDICNKLKSSPFTRHIPILVISGYPRIAETAIYEFGADEFIAKPFEIGELEQKIQAILSRKKQSVKI